MEEVDAVRRRLWRSNTYVLSPNDRAVKRWDLITFAALLFTAIVTPAEVAFIDDVDAKQIWTLFANPLWVLNRCVDVTFLCDICLQFFIGYRDPSRGNVFIHDRWLIAKRYLRSWFLVDCVSTFPSDARRRAGTKKGACRGPAAGAGWIFRGGVPRRRRGCRVDIPWGRIAAPPRGAGWIFHGGGRRRGVSRGYSVEVDRGDAAGTAWMFRGGASRQRRGYSPWTSGRGRAGERRARGRAGPRRRVGLPHVEWERCPADGPPGPPP